MTIAIIGAGNIGSGLARTFGRTHQVTVADKNPALASALAEKLQSEGLKVDNQAVSLAVERADIVILSIPFGAVNAIADSGDFTGKIVVDVTNPLKEDFSGLVLGFDTSAAEEIAKILGTAKVVKAFNTVFAQIYDHALDFGGRAVPTFIAADDTEAKEKVVELAREAGFDPVDAGPLTNARYLEPLGYLNIQFGYMLGHGTQIAPAWLSR